MIKTAVASTDWIYILYLNHHMMPAYRIEIIFLNSVIHLIFVMVKCSVLFEIRAELLSIISTCFSPYAAVPRFNAWIRVSNWMQWSAALLLSLIQLSPLPSSQLNILPSLQPTFTRRTSGHCLGTFIAVSLALPPPLLNMSHTTHPLSLLPLSSSASNC
jgi:hypothetical protein